ncbi:MAG TPA: hypothetical protein V6D12_07265 [Candidatus Obscuribacterales bacterium]
MGRNAKLKKIRREASSQPELSNQPQSQPDLDPTQFVQELERQGYQLKKVEHCPEIPE